MPSKFSKFEEIVRRAGRFTDRKPQAERDLHPFEERNIHPDLPSVVKSLFDNGHYPQATFEAFKYLEKEIQRHSTSSESGFKLMMSVFNSSSPMVQLTPLNTVSERDEQKGYQFLFAGSTLAIRNPRGHEYDLKDNPDLCLDHLGLASLLLRRLAQAGFR